MTNQIPNVFRWFTAATGQAIRLPSEHQKRQALRWLEMGYTEADMLLTGAYVRAEVAENERQGRGGLNARSLTWSNFMGMEYECEKFQANHGLASAKKQRKQPVAAPQSPVVASDGLYAAGAAAMAAAIQQLKGKR